MDRIEFGKWLDRYKAAWEERDPGQIVSLFTADAVYEEAPFEKPMRGRGAIRRYWEKGAQESQRDVNFSYEIYSVANDVGLCRWRCTFERVPSGPRVELDGIFRCIFVTDGSCCQFQEWWHRRVIADGK